MQAERVLQSKQAVSNEQLKTSKVPVDWGATALPEPDACTTTPKFWMPLWELTALLTATGTLQVSEVEATVVVVTAEPTALPLGSTKEQASELGDRLEGKLDVATVTAVPELTVTTLMLKGEMLPTEGQDVMNVLDEHRPVALLPEMKGAVHAPEPKHQPHSGKEEMDCTQEVQPEMERQS